MVKIGDKKFNIRNTGRFKGKIPLIVSLVKSSIAPEFLKKVYLFGSYAYGKPTKDSDIDLLVIIDDCYENEKARLEIRNKFFDNNIYPCDLIVKTEKEFKKKLESSFNGVYGVIRDNGVALYG